MLTGTCRLCLEEKPLLKKSHIIPEFMYKGLYDEDHKMLKGIPHEMASRSGKVDTAYSGEYEHGILCRHCDSEIIGRFEDYSHSVLYGGTFHEDPFPVNTNYRGADGLTFSRWTNINYTKFKLFLLSILWRAGISRRDFFADVRLGPYEEVLRKMILRGDPMKAEDFPVLLITWLNDPSLPNQLIGAPTKVTSQEGTRYILPIGGVVYVFHVSPNIVPPSLIPFTVLPNNEVSILHVPLGQGWDFIRRLLNV